MTKLARVVVTTDWGGSWQSMSDKDSPQKKKKAEQSMSTSLSGEVRLSASDFDSSERIYEKVRSWYLARLRKSAVEETARNVNLTPAALIVADREFVEKLIGNQATPPKTAMDRVMTQRDYLALLLFTWLGGSVAFMTLYYIERHGDIVSTAAAFYALSIGQLFGEAPPDLSGTSPFPLYVRLFPLFLIGWPLLGTTLIVLLSQLKPRDQTN